MDGRVFTADVSDIGCDNSDALAPEREAPPTNAFFYLTTTLRARRSGIPHLTNHELVYVVQCAC
jgi:hypothetical protein